MENMKKWKKRCGERSWRIRNDSMSHITKSGQILINVE